MTQAACRAANFAAFVKASDVIPQSQQQVFTKAMQDDHRGTRVNDVGCADDSGSASATPAHPHPTLAQSALDAVTLQALQLFLNAGGGQYVLPNSGSKHQHETFLHPEVEFLGELSVRGVRYSSSSRSLGSSHVMISPSPERYLPAQIQQIFRHARFDRGKRRSEIFVAVSLLQALDERDALANPFTNYKSFGSLWSTLFDQKVTVVSAMQLECHFARTWMEIPGMVVPSYHILPLSRVGPSAVQRARVVD